ncbi:putative RNA polymerase sigma factor [Advenella kashmirensis WT001]|uniref:Putative RNA polymerase sigma factor n=1 Tax=Advenella kashmirensis (strain DSM 17095 / LMG 22695 / WT001) TaxID=1036672 RepID=I3UER8_ADVKW|nr:sigma-70 family RNA polymerase sigma factor [Advenella kashmirensis]AFK63506.1 putative RNA polymerase sigma factor [Advenella kashmirensis WT001]
MAQHSDTEHLDLLLAVARKDRQAFEILYLRVSPRLYAVALRMLKRPELAEELLQDVFITVWNQAGNYNSQYSAPLTWMTNIVRNRAIDRLRVMEPAGTESGNEDLALLQDTDLGPAARYEQVRSSKKLDDCMKQLSAEQRQSIFLAYYHSLSHAAIAKQIAQPLGTTKSWIRRGLAQLKGCLQL